jgi:hypothetical protein
LLATIRYIRERAPNVPVILERAATDNVFPSGDHLPFLQRHFETVRLEERVTQLPYVPLLRTPYYLFIGRKP